jgi:hypothetical protein
MILRAQKCNRQELEPEDQVRHIIRKGRDKVGDNPSRKQSQAGTIMVVNDNLAGEIKTRDLEDSGLSMFLLRNYQSPSMNYGRAFFSPRIWYLMNT